MRRFQDAIGKTFFFLSLSVVTFFSFTVNSLPDCVPFWESLNTKYSDRFAPYPDPVCDFFDQIPVGTADACPTPTGLKTVINGNSVNFSWDPVPQALFYKVGFTNITTGTIQFINIDLTTITFNNLTTGVHIASIQSFCGGNTYSPPLLPEILILDDLIGVMPSPLDPDCTCPVTRTLSSNESIGTFGTLPWPIDPCSSQVYDIKLEYSPIAPTSGSLYYKIKAQMENTGAVITECSDKVQINTSTGRVELLDDSNIKIFEVAFSDSDGIIMGNTTTFTSPSGTFKHSIDMCCSKSGGKLKLKNPKGKERNASDDADGTFLPYQSINTLTVQAINNPFTHLLQVQCDIIGNKAPVELELFDAHGKRVATIAQMTERAAGTYLFEYNAAALTPGLYFLRVSSPLKNQTLKVVKM